MPSRGQRGSKGPASAKAALLYLDDGIQIDALSDRFGVGKAAIRAAVHRLRKERETGGVP